MCSDLEIAQTHGVYSFRLCRSSLCRVRCSVPSGQGGKRSVGRTGGQTDGLTGSRVSHSTGHEHRHSTRDRKDGRTRREWPWDGRAWCTRDGTGFPLRWLSPALLPPCPVLTRASNLDPDTPTMAFRRKGAGRDELRWGVSGTALASLPCAQISLRLCSLRTLQSSRLTRV
jgi:hypothetical protein